MKKDKRQIRKEVLWILEDDTKARSSDRYLYVAVVKKLNPQLAYAPLSIAMLDPNIPCMESVRRARQWCQAKYPDLKADENVQAARELEEEDFRKYATEVIP